MSATIGQPIPEFELRDQNRNVVSGASLQGRNSIIVFIPFPFTSTCGGEICDLRDRMGDFERLDANVVAVTCDTGAANRAWAEQNNVTYPVLSDFWPHGETSKAFGVFNETFGYANRTTFVVDAEGTVRDIVASTELGVARESDHYVTALEALAGLS
jgi:peroxiredoxin (alkyl hydroperoxide reductase subunit C)